MPERWEPNVALSEFFAALAEAELMAREAFLADLDQIPGSAVKMARHAQYWLTEACNQLERALDRQGQVDQELDMDQVRLWLAESGS